MKKFDLILLCAGEGTRFGNGGKPLVELDNGLPVFMNAFNCFRYHERLGNVILVYNKKYKEQYVHFGDNPFIYVQGGMTRQESVAFGMQQVTSEYVIIHDGVRPIIRKSLIDDMLVQLDDGFGAVIPIINLVETIVKIKGSDKNMVRNYPNRKDYSQLQTPQGYDSDMYKEVINHTIWYTTCYDEYPLEDSYMWTKFHDESPVFITSYPENWKLTYPCDLTIINALMKREKAIKIKPFGDDE